jgi:hypothetical protein
MLKRTMLLSTLALALVGVGCGSDNSNNNNAAKTYTISGQVIYTGTMPLTSNSLTVSADTRATPVCNAMQQDIPVKYMAYPSPTFPVGYSLSNIKAGSYYLFGFFNTDSNSGMCPDATDVCGHTTTPTELSDANPAPTVDITLDIVGCQVP